MNREILFRAWDKKTKKMREVNSIAFQCSYDTGFQSEDGLPKVINLWGWSITEDKPIILQREPKDVILLQATGLRDKNGTPIYEGDIVTGYRKGSNSDRVYTGIIEWRIEQAGWVIMCGKYILEILSLAMDGDGTETRLSSFEIMGNKYESPNLINKQQ